MATIRKAKDMLDMRRTDRIFSRALDFQEKRLDTDGVSFSGVISRIRRNARIRNLASDESYETYLASGFEGSFFDWIIENWDSVFAIITKLISLFAL